MSSPELPPEFQQNFDPDFADEPVDDEPETQDPEVLEDIMAITDADGPWHVRLLIPIDIAADPADAVENFIYEITENGLRDYLYRVVHVPSDEVFYVQRGRSLTEEEALANIEDDDDE